MGPKAPESNGMRILLRDWGVLDSAIILESVSQNTRENSLQVQQQPAGRSTNPAFSRNRSGVFTCFMAVRLMTYIGLLYQDLISLWSQFGENGCLSRLIYSQVQI